MLRFAGAGGREPYASAQHAAQQQAATQAALQSQAASPAPSLAANPWAPGANAAAGHNPWSTGLGGLQPQVLQQGSSAAEAPALHTASSSSGRAAESARPAPFVSQLNPAAGEFLAGGVPAAAPQAPPEIASSRPLNSLPASSNIWGAQGLWGAPAASHALQAPQWAPSPALQELSAAGVNAPGGVCQWASPAAVPEPSLTTSAALDWGQGASPPFSDAPLFLSSMMQQVIIKSTSPTTLYLLEYLISYKWSDMTCCCTPEFKGVMQSSCWWALQVT